MRYTKDFFLIHVLRIQFYFQFIIKEEKPEELDNCRMLGFSGNFRASEVRLLFELRMGHDKTVHARQKYEMFTLAPGGVKKGGS